jgi:hypothetical protein
VKTQKEYIKDAKSLIESAHRCDCKNPVPVYTQAINILNAIPARDLPYEEVRMIRILRAEAEQNISASLEGEKGGKL